MVVFTSGIMPDLEDHRTKLAATPSYCAELFRIVILLVYQVRLIEYLLRFFQADAMSSLGFPALRPIEVKAHFYLYNCYTIHRFESENHYDAARLTLASS